MNYIDIIIIAILAFSAIFGFINGFIKETASLVAIILGAWGAFKFLSFTTQKLYDFFDISGQYTGIIAFIITFGLIVIAIHFIGIIVNNLVKAMSFGILNRIIGCAFGFLKSVIILSILFSILNVIDAKRSFLPKEKIKQSALYNPVSDIIPSLFPIIGEGAFKHNFDRLKKSSSDKSI